jgi:hypothetical protein
MVVRIFKFGRHIVWPHLVHHSTTTRKLAFTHNTHSLWNTYGIVWNLHPSWLAIWCKGSSHMQIIWVYSSIPKSREWFVVNYIDITMNKLILDFYIFKGESMQKDYIRLFKQGTCITWKNVWMPSFLFKEFSTSLQKVSF